MEIGNRKVVLKPKVLVDKDHAWARLNQVMEKVGRRHRKISKKEVEEDVLEVIKATKSR